MAKHFVSVVGRRMEAVIEVDADSEADAIKAAAAKAGTLTERDWHMLDAPEVSGVERIYSPAERRELGMPLKAW